MIIKNKVNLTLVLVVFLTTLVGCSGKSAPDEFLVLKNAPLSLPPEFYLTPGGPDADLDEVVEPQDIAKRALFGSN
ncbi:DUF3035 domain-containing protein [Emcibacteraceae bacterium]|nr:DUF3035 domain-containing protein [Emcibacteraceae bacterium]